MDRFDFSERVAKYPLGPYRCVPQMHRMCIRSCYSVAAEQRGHLLGPEARRMLAERRDKMSLCDGKVLGAMESRRGVVEAYRASTLERRSAELRAKK